ncbi:MAG TPA: hypothetical protein VF595_02645 [Tepidisphaeraceae bacterium]|jgi:hypothetical protein
MAAPTTAPSEVKRAFALFLAAEKDEDVARLGQMIGATSRQEDLLRPHLADLIVAAAHFDRAMQEKFKREAAGKYAVAPTEADAAWQAADETVQGDAATLTATIGGQKVNVAMAKRDGVWRVTYGGAVTFAGVRKVDGSVPSDESMRRYTEMAQALRSTAAGVRAGEFPTAAAAAEAAQQRVIDAQSGRGAQ